jgi:hypothetical protein
VIGLKSITRTLRPSSTLHAARATPLAPWVWALLHRPRLGIAAIGRALAAATGATAQHAIKRVDRFVGNARLDLAQAPGDLMRHVLRGRRQVLLALDWTDAHDGVHQILACGVRAHGRAIPLAWLTVRQDQLRDHQRPYEQDLCRRVAAAIPAGCHVVIVADRGFVSPALIACWTALGWDWLIRVPGDRWVAHGAWRGPLWRLRVTGHGPVDWPDTALHKAQPLPGRLVVSENPGLPREPWYWFTSLTRWTAAQVRQAYAHRFQLEASFKDIQNDGGDGGHLAHVRLGTPPRWDRLLKIWAWAYWWWTLAGWWAEQQRLDRAWRTNTVPTRTHALWRLGYWVLHTTALRWRTLLRHAASFWAAVPPPAAASRDAPRPAAPVAPSRPAGLGALGHRPGRRWLGIALTPVTDRPRLADPALTPVRTPLLACLPASDGLSRVRSGNSWGITQGTGGIRFRPCANLSIFTGHLGLVCMSPISY